MSKDVCKNCYDCDHCQYIGEGDYICDVDITEAVVVVEDWSPTEDYYYCGGKEFTEKCL